MKLKFTLSLLLLAIFISPFAFVKETNAVAITVKRVVFEGPKRAEVVTVINNSGAKETFRMGWRHYVMTEDKSLTTVSEDALPPEVKPSKDMVRFSPRRFTLAPGASQQVRLMLRTPSGLADGEYRSHLWIRPEANVQAFSKGADGELKKGKLGVNVKMLTGVSMPVIVRKGQLEGDAEITRLDVRDVGTHIDVSYTLERQGQRSVYGDVDLVCNMGTSGEYLAQFSRGLAVYPEITKRNRTLRIPYKADKPKCNDITMRYSETDGFLGDITDILSEKKAIVQ